MKIETTIKPRRDGTVTVTAASGAKYEFKNIDGRLVAEVTDEGDLSFLLDREDFLPAEEADFEAAAKLVSVPEEEESGVDDGTLIGEVEDLDDDDPADMDAAPVEDPTPAAKVVAKGKGKK